MRQVAQIAEHTLILNRRLLAALVRLVLRVRTYEAEDALQDRRWQLGDEESSPRCRERDRDSGVLVGRDIGDGVFALLFVFRLVVLRRVDRLGLFSSLLEPIHDAVKSQGNGWREYCMADRGLGGRREVKWNSNSGGCCWR